MGGITSGTGIFSGINSDQIIAQLLAVEGRPKVLAQQRVIQLQQLQAVYLDLNSKVNALKTAAGAFRINNTFKSNQAVSSADTVLSATASTDATPGSYQFVVDRLVSTQQFLSRGFSSATSGGVNAGSFSFEPAVARLDRDTALAELNGGAGISRGKIVISDAGGHSATIDLSRAATVNDVLDAINSAGGISLSATVEGGKFVIKSGANSNLTITSAFGYSTAASLGIEQTTPSSSTVTGSQVYSMGANTALSSLNDGNGIFRNNQTGNARFDFKITVGATDVSINIGDKYNADNTIAESAPTTIGGMITRINDQLRAALGNGDVHAQIDSDGVSLSIVDDQGRTIAVSENTGATNSTTAADLGILTSSPQTGAVHGKRLLAGLNTTLARTLNGGAGLAGNGQISITGRDGVVRNIAVDPNGSLADIVTAFNNEPSGKIHAALSSRGTGIVITDTTGGTGNLIISGQTAQSLGIQTDPAGVASATVTGTNLQHQYVAHQTLLSGLRAGQGVGTGKFRITDSTGRTAEVTVSDTTKTLDDLIQNINSRGTRIQARINAKGDGLELFESSSGGGTQAIKVEDVSGTVAANLYIAGTAPGTGAQNVIDGSGERTVAFAATDTLQQVADKISAAGVGVTAAVINDGAGSTPFRLSLTARGSGTAGRFVVDSGAFDLGLTQLDAGNDAKVFFGSSDPARAVLLSSSRNTLDGVIRGVTIDLKSVSDNPVTLTVSRDTGAIETAINTFISAFNTLTQSIADKSKYDQDSDTRGPLLGDSSAETIRSGVLAAVQGSAQGLTGQYLNFAQVGITVGQGGQLQFDRERFRTALQNDPQAVTDLFTARVQIPNGPTTIPNTGGATTTDPNAPARFSSLGVAGIIENLANSYIDSVNGLLTRRRNTLNDQIAAQNQRIADIDERLASRREILQRQFLAMEQAIGQLQQQQTSLSQIGG